MYTIEHLFDWVAANYINLERSYNALDNKQKQNLPFALYCIAMYKKHSELF